MDFRVTGVITQDHYMVVQVDHYNADASFWFSENYYFQGREGLRQKRSTDVNGMVLQDDGTVAPVDEEGEPYLEPGKSWAWEPPPRMVNDSILDVVRSIHAQRVANGWPQGRRDALRPVPPAAIKQADIDGAPTLITQFSSLVGHTE